MRTTGLDRRCAPPWPAGGHPRTVHGPAKTCIDLAITLALGGDYLADAAAALLRPGNTAADHIHVAAHALKQLPRAHRRGRATPSAPTPPAAPTPSSTGSPARADACFTRWA
ncbi:hypothetical protein GCM10009800_47750 [Nocardiopsis rhodophaea]